MELAKLPRITNEVTLVVVSDQAPPEVTKEITSKELVSSVLADCNKISCGLFWQRKKILHEILLH